MESDYMGPVNIGNPIEMTVLELAQKICKLTNNDKPFKKLPLPENDPKQRRPDITLAKTILTWQPQVSLDVGLEKTLKYFGKNS